MRPFSDAPTFPEASSSLKSATATLKVPLILLGTMRYHAATAPPARTRSKTTTAGSTGMTTVPTWMMFLPMATSEAPAPTLPRIVSPPRPPWRRRRKGPSQSRLPAGSSLGIPRGSARRSRRRGRRPGRAKATPRPSDDHVPGCAHDLADRRGGEQAGDRLGDVGEVVEQPVAGAHDGAAARHLRVAG